MTVMSWPRRIWGLGPGATAAMLMIGGGLLVQSNAYWLHVATLGLLYAILAVAVGFTAGMRGLLDLGSIAAAAAGAYAAANVASRASSSLLLSPVVGGLAGALLGVVLLPALARLGGHLYVLASLAVCQAVAVLLINGGQATGGPDGLAVPSWLDVSRSNPEALARINFAATAVLLALCLGMAVRFRCSRFGRGCIAAADDAVAAGCFAVSSVGSARVAILMAAVMSGAAGGMYARVLGYIAPGSFSLSEALIILAFVLIAGGTWPPGTAAIACGGVAATEGLRVLGEYRLPAFGLLILLVAIRFPRGILFRSFSLHNAADADELPRVRSLKVHARGICKSFDGTGVLQGVDFDASAGETVGLSGANGAGKTVFLNLLSGIYQPEHGQLTLGAESDSWYPDSPATAALRGVARSFQSPRVWPRLSASENVLVGAQVRASYTVFDVLVGSRRYWREEAQLLRRADLEIDAFGDCIRPRANNTPLALSYANRRRLEIARALARCPGLLLLDEPAAGMNPEETAELASYLANVGAVTRIVVGHKPQVFELLNATRWDAVGGRFVRADEPLGLESKGKEHSAP